MESETSETKKRSSRSATQKSAPIFVGWIRRGRGKWPGRWRRFCRASSYGECLEMLLDRVQSGVDKLVREGESDPNEEKIV